MIEDYLQAFARNYPHHHVRVKPVRGKRDEAPKYRVFINGDGGDMLLTESDIRAATRMFNRGKSLR